MTKVFILGGGGMVGQKLAHHLLANGLNGDTELQVTGVDIGFPPTGAGFHATHTGNLTDPAIIATIATAKPDVIFHLAAIVSGESETNFDKGWATNMMSMWQLLSALREQTLTDPTYVPRFVFTSSIAVFGAPFPAKIDDTFFSAPQTSYGAQKAMDELMISDFSRKGFIDGISIRLPTICVRPGKANLAASSFFSGIIREPLNGKPAILPVPDTVRHWHASPKTAVGFLTHSAGLDTARLENRRALNLPGVSCTVAEQIDALRRIAGEKPVALIKPEPDAAIMKIVAGWPRDFDPQRAISLGFVAEDSFDQIVQTYIDDDLGRS